MTTELDTLPLLDQVEHLKHMIAEMTASAESETTCAAFPGVRFRRANARFLNLLMHRAPMVVPYSAIEAAMLWDRCGNGYVQSGTINAHACMVRRQLRELGHPCPFEAVRFIGYRWTAAKEATA
jgi:DNA-binding response OmpR family regulator